MQGYKSFSGTIVKKKKTLLGKYTLTVADEAHKVTVLCGKAIFDRLSVGSTVTIGHSGKQLINIRPGVHKDDQ